MKKIIQDRLSEIQVKIQGLVNSPVSYQILNAQASLLIGIMNEYEEKIKRAYVEDIMNSYNMGLFTPDEVIIKVNAISVEY